MADNNKNKAPNFDKDSLYAIMAETEKLAGVGSWEWDIARDLWTFSDNWLNIHGRADCHLKTADLIEIAHPDDRNDILLAFDQVVKDGTDYDIEHRIIRQDTGEKRYIRSSGKPRLDKDGKVIKILGSAQDITGQREAEKKLIEKEKRLSEAQRIAQVGDWDWDPATNTVTWSEQLYQIFSLDPGEPPPNYKGQLRLYHPEDSVRLNEAVTTALREGTPYELELRRTNPDGQIVHFLVRGRVETDQSGTLTRLYGTVQDITERIAAEKALQEINSELKLAQKIARIGNWSLDPEVGVAEWSEEVYEIYERDRSLGPVPLADYAKLYSGVWWETFINAIQNAIQKGIPYDIELKTKLPSGKEKWIHAICEPKSKIGPKGYKLRGTIQDITERKNAEKALKESGERLQAVFNTVDGVPIQGYNKDRHVIFWNPASEKLYGYTSNEALGRELEELIIPKESRRAVVEGIQQWHKQGIAVPSGEIELLNKSGERLQVYSNHVMISNHRGEKEMFCIDVDLTERKRAEEVLRESERRFATVFQYSPAPLVLSEIDTGLFLDVNDRWIEMLEFTREEQIGKTSKEVGIWDDPGERDRIVAKLRFEGRFRDEHIRFKTRSGKIIIALWSAESVNLSGKQVMLSMITDITQLRQAEEERERLGAQLQQAQKMESVGRLAGGIAHDFNNMLGVILGHTEMALEEADPASPLYTNLHSVHQAGERSADLTRQLLAFARKQTVAPKVIDINDTIIGMLNMLRRLIGENVGLLWQPGRNLQTVKIDPSQIDQLLANLCVNARDAIDGVGKITIETKAKTFDDDYCHDHLEALTGEYVLLEVSDDGCGMDKKTLSQVFEPFFTTKEQGQGTGLGLASVFGIVKQNNGFINVYSEPGQGTAFKIYLPVYVAKSVEVADKTHNPPIEQGNETILLVEDESAILKMITTMLEKLGYTVVSAATPGEAIRLAQEYQGQIDLLMTDVVMPEMNGRELTKNLLSHYPNIKRLFMSGYTADVIAHHGVLDEGVHFIQKPFSRKDLGGKVREVLES